MSKLAVNWLGRVAGLVFVVRNMPPLRLISLQEVWLRFVVESSENRLVLQLIHELLVLTLKKYFEYNINLFIV